MTRGAAPDQGNALTPRAPPQGVDLRGQGEAPTRAGAARVGLIMENRPRE